MNTGRVGLRSGAGVSEYQPEMKNTKIYVILLLLQLDVPESQNTVKLRQVNEGKRVKEHYIVASK